MEVTWAFIRRAPWESSSPNLRPPSPAAGPLSLRGGGGSYKMEIEERKHPHKSRKNRFFKFFGGLNQVGKRPQSYFLKFFSKLRALRRSLFAF